jgi:hypothetical protein
VTETAKNRVNDLASTLSVNGNQCGDYRRSFGLPSERETHD